ncbi:hypothetical protein SANTM175S_10604 [Streptomyces antimycoticus]
MNAAAPAVHQAAALLLGYPGPDWPARRTLVRDCLIELGTPAAAPLLRFCAAVDGVPVLDLASAYVRTFDRSRRRTLHLTYYTDGDTRRRGGTLTALKAHYRPTDGRPPDDCPITCRCCWSSPPAARPRAAGSCATTAPPWNCCGWPLPTTAARMPTSCAPSATPCPDPHPPTARRPSRSPAAGPPTETVGLAPFAATTPAAPSPVEGTGR